MEDTSSPDVNLEPEEDIPSTEPAPASFKGRLNLSEYTFTPNSSSPRRSLQKTKLNSPAVHSSTAIPTAKRKSSTHLSPSPSPSPRKKSRSPTGYVSPSTYSHLPPLPDVLAPNLICVFIGLNPGLETSRSGHAYAHPSNLFWKLLHSSGCTTRRLSPTEDRSLPELFSLGNTNIVSRPTRNGSELSKREMDESVGVLEEKIRACKPEAVCLVGKGIWESVFRVWKGRGLGKGKFEYGWQVGWRMGAEEGWEGAKVFVASSTSGLAATVRPEEKERIWRGLGAWVEERRRLRVGGLEEEVGGLQTEEIKIEKVT